MGENYSAEQLSAEVLKTLKSFITDENISSVVITVPAKFTINQKEATTKAAALAGFTHCELLQEPIAASMAYGISSVQKHGYWLVFDFGGGTFDAALLKVEDGIMQVFDTEGDNYLGGKNLDEALVNELFIPYLKNKFNVEVISKYKRLCYHMNFARSKIIFVLSNYDNSSSLVFHLQKNVGLSTTRTLANLLFNRKFARNKFSI